MAQVLRPVQAHHAFSHADLIVGVSQGDDAGVYSLGDGRALIQSVDVFTPIVDDPYDWGYIAGINALSDIYAMGGVPLTAMQYLSWPRDQLPFALASDVLAGGLDAMAAEGCTVVGGHSVDGPEPTYGFAVTGLADQERLLTNSGARVGASLVLTKPLGSGIVTTAIKRGKADKSVTDAVVRLMRGSNRGSSVAALEVGAIAATDVTGFGLLGHLSEILDNSGVGAELDFDSVPVIPGVADLLEMGMWPSGSQRNLEAVAGRVTTDLESWKLRLLADAQTSGGLLVVLPEGALGDFISRVPDAHTIGRIVETGLTIR